MSGKWIGISSWRMARMESGCGAIYSRPSFQSSVKAPVDFLRGTALQAPTHVAVRGRRFKTRVKVSLVCLQAV